MSNSTYNNIQQRWKLLNNVLNDINTINKAIANACESQQAFANFELSANGIQRLSINTLKAGANKFIEKIGSQSGWEQLELLRIKINHAVKSQREKGSATKKCADKEKIADLQLRCDLANRERFRICQAYFELLSMLNNIAKSDEKLKKKLDIHLDSFSIKHLKQVESGKDV